MLKFCFVCIILWLGPTKFIFALEANLREELLNSEDIEIVRSRNFRNISFTSPSNKRCLVVASTTGCTRWKEMNCRAQRSVEIYDPECSILNGRKVKNCKVQNDIASAENTVSICGLKWTRECQGPCYNCPESCKPQFEKTCWRNQEVKNAVNIISINGVDIYAEKEYLESLYSCSQNKIADVCAPNNCRFIESPEDCIVQNDTKIVDLKTRTCTLCTAHIQQDRGTCEEILREDCRNEFPLAWTKLCSYEDTHSKDLILPIPTSPDKQEIMADFAALYSKSLGPVNNLILNTLKDIEVGDVTNDTVIIISTPKSFTENHQGKEFEIVQEMIHDGEHISVNVSVKYDFTEQEQPKALEHKPAATTFRPRTKPLLSSDQETYKILDLPYNSEDYNNQEAVEYNTAAIETFDTSNTGGNSLEEMIDRQQSGDNVYFDPLFQILNDRDRNELSSPAITTQRYQQPTFIFNSKTSSQLPTMTTPTTTTTATSTTTTTTTTARSTTTEIGSTDSILLTTLVPASPLSVNPDNLNDSGASDNEFLEDLLSIDLTTISSTTTTTSTSTVASTDRSTKAKPERKKLTAGDLLKLCFLNNIGCDFDYEEAMTARPTTQSTTTTTTRRTTTKAADNSGLSAEEKVRLCFTYSICDEDQFAELEERKQGESLVRQPRIDDEPILITTTTTRRTTTTTESESYKELKERAALCFWKGIC